MQESRIPRSSLATASGHNFRILVAGGGIGGVAAALALSQAGFANILVLERNSAAQTVGGAGISVKANLSRHLKILGVWNDVCKGVVVPHGWLAIDAKTGSTLAERSFSTPAGNDRPVQGSCRRADILNSLVLHARQQGVKFEHDARVTDVDFDKTAVQVTSGDGAQSWRSADLVIAADGIRSVVAAQLCGRKREVIETGTAILRVVLTRSEALALDATFVDFFEPPHLETWQSPGFMAMVYPIGPGASELNLVLFHRNLTNLTADSGPLATWAQPASKEHLGRLLQQVSGQQTRFHRLLSLVPQNTLGEWRADYFTPASTWRRGRVILLGDAASAQLPHLAQGAASAVEDAVALATALAYAQSADAIPHVLQVYEAERRPRREAQVKMAYEMHRKLLQLDAQGPEAASGDGSVLPKTDRLHSLLQKEDPTKVVMMENMDTYDAVKAMQKRYLQKSSKESRAQ